MGRNAHIRIIIALSLMVVGIVSYIPPIPQDLAYHAFIDNRALWGIPNFGDVVGNLPFILFGVMGYGFVYKNQKNHQCFILPKEPLLWKIFFFGTALVGFGSGYYHLNPNNETLVWDRLPMTIAFMSFFSLVIMERISVKKGLMLFPVLLGIGIASVWYWDYTESLGQGDLRLYVLVQFLPLLLMPLMFWLFPAQYSGLKYLGFVLGWYILAKLLEHFDGAVFALSQQTVSGHTLKHLAASVSVYTMLLYLKKRKV